MIVGFVLFAGLLLIQVESYRYIYSPRTILNGKRQNPSVIVPGNTDISKSNTPFSSIFMVGYNSYGGQSRQNHRNYNNFRQNENSDYGLNSATFNRKVAIDPLREDLIDDVNITSATKDALRAKGFTKLTPVQCQSLDYITSGNDIVVRSRTGTGKTLAFGIPIIESLIRKASDRSNPKSLFPRLLILEPTRELAVQVSKELSSVFAPQGISVAPIFGGVSVGVQEQELRNGVDVVVGTPGRLLDLISRGSLNLHDISHIVLDEGDTMLEMGFQKDVETIMDQCTQENSGDTESSVQMMLFSATMPTWICKLTQSFMKNPVYLDSVATGETKMAPTITHYVVYCKDNNWETLTEALHSVLVSHGNDKKAIIFTNTKNEANDLSNSPAFSKISYGLIHGDITQYQRQNTLDQFRRGQISVLIATDVAARGLDIEGVDLVLHSSIPRDLDSFVHRSGRTGRAGRLGSSVVFVPPSRNQLDALQQAQQQLKITFQNFKLPSEAELKESCMKRSWERVLEVDDIRQYIFLSRAKKLCRDFGMDSSSLGADKYHEFQSLVSKMMAVTCESFPSITG